MRVKTIGFGDAHGILDALRVAPMEANRWHSPTVVGAFNAPDMTNPGSGQVFESASRLLIHECVIHISPSTMILAVDARRAQRRSYASAAARWIHRTAQRAATVLHPFEPRILTFILAESGDVRRLRKLVADPPPEIDEGPHWLHDI